VDKAKAQEAKAKGNVAFSAKSYEEAIKHFTEAIGHDPTDHVFFSNRSACLASLERYEQALEDGAQCVKLKPDWPKGYTRKGLAEFFLERYDDAAETYKAGLKLAPEDPAIREGLQKAMDAKYGLPRGPAAGGGAAPMDGGMGSLFTKVDRAKLAVLALRNPKLKEYLSDEALMKKVDMVASIGSGGGGSDISQRMLMQSVQEDPRILEVFAAASGMEVRLADPDEAAGAGAGGGGSRGSAAEAPGRPPPASSPASSAASSPRPGVPKVPLHRAAAAKAQEEKAPEDPRTPRQKEADELKNEGNQLYRKRKFDEAIGCYDKAIEKEPNDLTYYNNKCAVLVELGDENYPKVLKTCEDLLSRRYEINSENAGGASFEKVAKVYCRMASVYEKQHKFDEAIAMYHKSLTEDNNRQTRSSLRELERKKEKWEKESYLDPVKAEEHREKGNEHFKANDFVKSKAEYDEAIRRNPREAKLYSNRAAALTKLLAYPDALRDLEECLKLDPTFVKAYSRKGAAHFFMKEYHKALESYEKGLAIDKANEECLRGREQVLAKVASTQGSDEVDEEQIRHAMADPEIQRILHDPQIQLFLRSMKEDPAEAQKAMKKEPKLQEAMSKLIAAGIVRTR